MVFLASIGFLWLLTTNSPSSEILRAANEVLIAISAIFFSIFMLFTASQNFPHTQSLSMFKRGLPHRFRQVDRFVAWLAIVALGLAAAGRILVEVLPLKSFHGLRIGILDFTLSDLTLGITALGITFMANSLFAVVNYYSERTRYLHETDLSRQLLDQRFEEQNQAKNEQQ